MFYLEFSTKFGIKELELIYLQIKERSAVTVLQIVKKLPEDRIFFLKSNEKQSDMKQEFLKAVYLVQFCI